MTAMALGLDGVAEECRKRHSDEQDNDQNIFELLQENRPRRDSMTGLQFHWARTPAIGAATQLR